MWCEQLSVVGPGSMVLADNVVYPGGLAVAAVAAVAAV